MRTEIPQFLFFVSTYQELGERDSVTYLGMLFDMHMSLHHAATHALRPFNAALRRVKEFGIEKRISDRPHAFQDICIVSWHVCQSDLVYAILKHDNGFSNPLQVAHTWRF
jgi:hypothetical protein